MRNNTGIQFVKSKDCKDCGKRIYFDDIKHQFCDDDSLKIRHDCPYYKTQRKLADYRTDELERLIIANHSILLERLNSMHKSLWELHMKVDKLLGDSK